MYIGTLTEEHLGTKSVVFGGIRYGLGMAFGYIQPDDVGTKVYITDGILRFDWSTSVGALKIGPPPIPPDPEVLNTQRCLDAYLDAIDGSGLASDVGTGLLHVRSCRSHYNALLRRLTNQMLQVEARATRELGVDWASMYPQGPDAL